jgi:hypothetical protein
MAEELEKEYEADSEPSDKPKPSKKDDSTVIERAKKRLKRMVDLMAKAHEVGKECMEFVAGEQWNEDDVRSREGSKRPMLTINKLDNFVNVVVNKYAMDRSRIKVVPARDASADTAKVINGLFRSIQYDEKSDAGAAFAACHFSLVTMGFGYVKVDTEYCDDDSVTEQDIIISKVEDALSVYLDPKGRFAFEVTFIDRDDAEEEYGEIHPDDWGTNLSGDADEVMIVKYWEKTETPVDIYQIEISEPIADPTALSQEVGIEQQIDASISGEQPPYGRRITVSAEELEEYQERYPDLVNVVASRKSKKVEVKQYLFCGNDEIGDDKGGKFWPGKYIPIVGCYARKFKLRDGTFFYKPLIFNALDPQKYYNFLKTQDFEMMMSAPRSKWVGVKGQFEGFEDDYDNANVSLSARLEYNAVDINGQPAPPPHRTDPAMPNQAFYKNIADANQEIKDTIGMHEASLGQQGNETSGKAIIARRQQGDVSTYHFTVAANATLLQVGIVIEDLRPHIYDSARTVSILGEDMADEVAQINQPYVDPKDGKPKNYDMSIGRYDVKIDTGSSSLTRRMDAAENLLEFARVVPTAGSVIADFIAKNLDFEYADEVALRLKAQLDPNLLVRTKQLEQGDNGGPSPEQQQMQKMGQAIQGMQQQIQKDKQVINDLAKKNMAMMQKIRSDAIAIEQIKARAGVQEKTIEAAADVRVAQIENNPIRVNNPIPGQVVAPPGGRQNMAMNVNRGGM